MTNSKTKKFIKGQIMRLRAKVRLNKLELKIFLDFAYNFSHRANVTKDAISFYKSRIYALENEEELTRV